VSCTIRWAGEERRNCVIGKFETWQKLISQISVAKPLSSFGRKQGAQLGQQLVVGEQICENVHTKDGLRASQSNLS
jgi:hypothetical protein